jgi:serine/threonine protein kinase
MSDFPDFSDHHYQVKKELGHNRAGGRVTYLALDTKTRQSVVIKQFQFAKTGSTWQSYDAYDREIQLLKELDHPGIPHYLDSFQTDDGFCMVQEYKQAESLAISRSFNPEEVKQIAIAALEILVYLQNRVPPVIHRDIKPANILVGEDGGVYLVDFGFARVGEGEVGVSSVVKGTLGFMPPEQLFNRQLTEASDLYGLGMTLICLLTATKADQIGELVDITYRVSFKHLVPKLNGHWVNWLEKMVEPRLKDRFPNAVAALAAIPSTPLRPPEAHFSQANLQFTARKAGEFLTQLVTITNPIPETTLEGQWEIVPHPNDPDANLYRWITVAPTEFVSNQVECQITVETRRLMPGKTYNRKLLLHSNTLAKTYPVNLQIQTAAVSNTSNLLPYGLLSLLGITSLGISWFVSWMVLVVKTIAESAGVECLAILTGAAIGLQLSAWIMHSSGWRSGATASFWAAITTGFIVFMQLLIEPSSGGNSGLIFEAVAGAIGGAAIGIALGVVSERIVANGNSKGLAAIVSLSVTVMGVALGTGWAIGFLNSLVLTTLMISALSFIVLIIHLELKRANNHLPHRPSVRTFIKP